MVPAYCLGRQFQKKKKKKKQQQQQQRNDIINNYWLPLFVSIV